MADLTVSYTELRALGNNVQAKGEEFGSLLAKIAENNNALKTAWEGTDASKYSNTVEEQSQVMNKLKNTIVEIGAYLVKAADLYEAANEANRNY